jgi:hypothetical protein
VVLKIISHAPAKFFSETKKSTVLTFTLLEKEFYETAWEQNPPTVVKKFLLPEFQTFSDVLGF